MRRSVRPVALLVLVLAAPALAGCFAAEGASTNNFTLAPQKVGWYAGDEAHFVLSITSTFFRSDPSYTLDRSFAIEEMEFEEQGIKFGGGYSTRNPGDLQLRLARANVTGQEFQLDAANPQVDVFVKLPESLRDSSYVFRVKLFEVGWVESGVFRVDHREAAP